MFDDDDYYAQQQGLQIINHLRQMDSVIHQIKYIIILLNSLDNELIEEFRNDLAYFEKLYDDTQFMREVQERDGLVQEYKVEYFGRDYGFDDPFQYKAELEKKITRVTKRILECAGRIINEMKSAGGIELGGNM